MLFGFDTFAAQPWAAIDNIAGDAVLLPAGNNLSLASAGVGIAANTINEVAGADPLTLKSSDTYVVSTTSILNISANPLTLALGNYVVSGTAEVTALKNALTCTTGAVTIQASVGIDPTPINFTLQSNEGGTTDVITWNDIIPGATNMWTDIVPY